MKVCCISHWHRNLVVLMLLSNVVWCILTCTKPATVNWRHQVKNVSRRSWMCSAESCSSKYIRSDIYMIRMKTQLQDTTAIASRCHIQYRFNDRPRLRPWMQLHSESYSSNCLALSFRLETEWKSRGDFIVDLNYNLYISGAIQETSAAPMCHGPSL